MTINLEHLNSFKSLPVIGIVDAYINVLKTEHGRLSKDPEKPPKVLLLFKPNYDRLVKVTGREEVVTLN